jgi:hypothetical protein
MSHTLAMIYRRAIAPTAKAMMLPKTLMPSLLPAPVYVATTGLVVVAFHEDQTVPLAAATGVLMPDGVGQTEMVVMGATGLLVAVEAQSAQLNEDTELTETGFEELAGAQSLQLTLAALVVVATTGLEEVVGNQSPQATLVVEAIETGLDEVEVLTLSQSPQ